MHQPTTRQILPVIIQDPNQIQNIRPDNDKQNKMLIQMTTPLLKIQKPTLEKTHRTKTK